MRVLAAEQEGRRNLRAHGAFAAAEAEKDNAELGVAREVGVGRNAGGLVDHERDARGLGDGEHSA